MAKASESDDGGIGRDFESMRRFDLVLEKQVLDEESRTFRAIVKPHPDRYKKLEGEKNLFFDKYLNELIPFEEFAEQIAGLPIFASDRTIDSTEEYATIRRAAISREVSGGVHEPPINISQSSKPLSIASVEKRLGFISIDIVGSTALRLEDSAKFDRSLEFFVKEIGNLAAVMGASVLKTTGDGLILFVDHPSFNVQTDTVNDFICSIIPFNSLSLSPALLEADLLAFSLRVGADYGPAIVKEQVVPATGFRQLDVASDALNRAVKIERTASVNEVRVGWHLYRLSHVQWLKSAEEIDTTGMALGTYRVFKLS